MKQKTFSAAFTIVELVIVVAVIGILAGLTVLGIGQWRTSVAETEVKSDLSNVQAGMDDARNRNDGYPVFPEGTIFDGSNDTKDIFIQSEYVTITYARGTATGYCLDVRSKAVPGVYLFLDTAGGNTTPQTGTCDGGAGATPPSPDQTVFVFDTTAPGCSGTVALPVYQPATGGTVSWGDGQVQTRTGSLMTHTYTTPGKYTVTYEGPITQARYYGVAYANNASCLTRVNQWANNISPNRVSLGYAANLAYVAEPPGTVTDMSYMFYGTSSFNQAIGGWDMSNVNNIQGIFYNATSFNQPIGNWNTSTITNMSDVFRGASAFNQPIGTWNTSGVTNMARLFYATGAFNQPINSWDTSNVTDMQNMFGGTAMFNQPIGSWDLSSLTVMANMFSNALAFNQPLANWDTSNVTNMGCVFYDSDKFNQPINSWDTSNVTNMAGMFYQTPFNQNISAWSTVNVTNMSSMFWGSSFNQNISGWNVTNVATWSNFHHASSLSQANCPPKLW